MAITNFIPTVWSENLLRSMDQQYVGISNCNREYEGEILEKGSKVKICGLNAVTVGDYEKNQDLSSPEVLSDTAVELVIDQAKYFNFQIDDVDRAQSVPGLMDLALRNAASALAKEADKYVYSLVENAALEVVDPSPTPDSVIETIIKARTKLMREGVNDPNDIVLEVSPEVAELILKSKLFNNLDSTDVMETGCIGNVVGCKVFVSSSIAELDDADGPCYACMMRTRRAIAFAEQLSEIEAYRPELRFADGMKGLHLYGAKVVYPREIVLMKFCLL
ncbi:MAG: P22 coat protein - protein 5 domain protein [Ruminococcaceae bacterium]|nr:P22 coat protein - protein 5 domain protein [Oscillospiraceae bacterium]